MRRSSIFLAELLTGIKELNVRDAGRARELLRMLSLDRLEVGSATSLDGAWAPEAGAQRRTGDQPSTAAPTTTPSPETPAPRAMGDMREARLRELGASTLDQQPPSWYLDVEAVARSAAPTPAASKTVPLFPLHQTRGLLTAAIATWNEDGPLDVDRIIHKIARLEPVREVPLEVTATTRRGVQLLIDTGVGMGPFRLDVDHMVREMGRLIARDQMRVLFFAGCPTRECVAEGKDELRSWTAPPHGTPVFLLSDLGIGAPPVAQDRAPIDEWLEFGQRVRSAGCPAIALVPYGPRRWPRELTRVFRLIHWDRRTTAGVVRRALMKASRGAR